MTAAGSSIHPAVCGARGFSLNRYFLGLVATVHPFQAEQLCRSHTFRLISAEKNFGRW